MMGPRRNYASDTKTDILDSTLQDAWRHGISARRLAPWDPSQTLGAMGSQPDAWHYGIQARRLAPWDPSQTLGAMGSEVGTVTVLSVGCLTSQQHAIVYLRDGSAQMIVRAVALRKKLHTKLPTSPSRNILTPDQAVPALTPEH